MNRIWFFGAMLIASACAKAEEMKPLEAAPLETAATKPDAAPPPNPSPTTRKTVEHDGQAFELANTTVGKNVETDEYVVAGEKIGDWTQLLTVQRLTLAKPTPTDEFLAYFQKKVQTEDGGTLEVLKQHKGASVFAVRFPKSERNEEQVMICLAFTDAANAPVLNIVQYAIKPTRASVDLVAMRIKSWRDKFVQQAQALAR